MIEAPFATLPGIVQSLEASVVSFDIFDTLLCRRVEPEWLKRCVAAELKRQMRSSAAIDVLALQRRKIEEEVATERVARGLDNDAKHQDVIERWIASQPEKKNDSITKHLLDYELDLEKKLTFAAPGIRQLLTTLCSANRRLIYVSDMYLSQASIDALLTHHALRRFFSRGYVSVEYGLRKSTGRLFEKILVEERLSPASLLHVGDNALGDNVAPRALGIQTILIRDPDEDKRRRALQAYEWSARRDPAHEATAFVDDLIRSAKRSVKTNRDVNYRTGLTFAPALVAFCEKLEEECAKNDVEHVYFLAREGLTLQRISRLIAKPAKRRRSSYLFLSRAATFLPSMRSLARDDLLRFLSQYSRQSLRSFLKNLCLPEDELLPLARECGVTDPDFVFSNFIDDTKVRRFLTHPGVYGVFARVHSQSHKLLLAYLRDRGVFRHRRIAFVDIGWKGSIQDNVVRAIESEPDAPKVYGYYVGLLSASPLKQGLLGELDSPDLAEQDVFRNSAMFEMITTADHGSTVGYRWGTYKPKIAVPVLVGHQEEKRNASQFFGSAQQGILDWANDYGFFRDAFPFSSDDLKRGALALISRYVRYPTEEEAEEFLRYSHVESFGVHEVTTYEWKFNWRQALASGHPLRAAWRSFQVNPWREGALKRSHIPLLNFAYDCWHLAKQRTPTKSKRAQ